MSEIKRAVVSSTARDLPEHRKQVMDACLRQSYQPKMMEHLPANSDDAIAASMKLVDEADIYIGVFALRYGYVPAGHDISITEMEYNRAVERGIPRLIFIAGEDHPFTAKQMEPEPENIPKLRAFKERVGKELVVNFFNSHEELRTLAVHSLSQLPKDPNAAFQYHIISSIPDLSKPYIAHPYVLSEAKGLIGRNFELNLLTYWITGKTVSFSDGYRRNLAPVRIFNIVAIGGMGKSALTWEWFNKIAPQEWPQVQGRVWWSFYESDARFENFVLRTLAYLGKMPIAEAQKYDVNQREDLLLQLLNEQPHLLVLDGFERELVAYTRLDANRLADDEYETATANYVANAIGLPESAAQSFTGQHRLRHTADRRTGQFLKRLARVEKSRILITTRLYPFELQMRNGNPMPGCDASFLYGLNDDDALHLWREFGATGPRERLLPLFRRFGSHPLLLQALAGEIARFRPAPGDFERWQEANPDFNPFSLPLVQAKTHVMQYALQGLDAAERQVLRTIAAFRMPCSYDTLLGICTGEGKPCADSTALDRILTELEDRGLVGWDKQHNRYDLHPVVRGVVWTGTNADEQRGVYEVMHTHFAAAPMVEDYLEVNSLEDLTPAIELYYALVGLERYDEAYEVFKDKLDEATLYRLGASRQRMELLEKFFPDGLDQLPRLNEGYQKSYICNALAQAYLFSGEPSKAITYFNKAIETDKNDNFLQGLKVKLANSSDALRFSGLINAAEKAVQDAWEISRELKDERWECICMYALGLTLSLRRQTEQGISSLEQSLKYWKSQHHIQSEGLINAYLAQHYLWHLQPNQALIHADLAWELAHENRLERDFIRAACRQGQAALGLGQYDKAAERLHHALERARKINLVEEELPTLIALAELARQKGQLPEARELLESVWDAAERGPFPFFHADALCVLCEIERAEGKEAAARAAAEEAYRLALAQGEPYVYRYGLDKAKQLLASLSS